MTTAISTVVPIQGTFDIALARNALRTRISRLRWPTIFNARAAMALTALGELILHVESSRPIVISIEMLEQSQKCGIRLSCRFALGDKKPLYWDERKQNLKRVSQDTDIQESEGEIEVTTYIWVD